MRFWGRSNELGVGWGVGLRKIKVINGQWFCRLRIIRQSYATMILWEFSG